MTDPSVLPQKVAEARRALAAGRRADAWAIMNDLLKAFPNDSRVMLETGLTGLRGGYVREAIGVLRRATKQWPDIAMGWALLGEALARQRDHHGAVAHYRRAVAVDPNHQQIRTAAAMAFANAGETDEAIAVLSRLASLPDASFAVKARLAGLVLQRSGFAAAEPAFTAAVAMMKASLEAGAFDEALRNESQLNQWFVRPIEDEAHQERCFSLWRDAMTQAGEKAAAALPPLPPRVQLAARKQTAAPVVGFFLHAASMLGHVELMLDYLEAMKNAVVPEIEPRIYVYAGFDRGLQNEARRRGLPLTFLDTAWTGGAADMPYKKLLWLRNQLASDGVKALVWISAPEYVHFGAALGVAPVNIFWALRFRPVASPYVQGYVACASCFEQEDMVNGRRWDVIPLAFRDLTGPERAKDVAAIRRDLGNPAIVFATLARGEKMQGEAWLEAIGRTLKACPQALFLWTGRNGEDPLVARALREMGVADQCRFIGWVDTRFYAQVLDIFLDTAPIGCGMTAMEAMAWGKPLVSFKDPLTNWGQCLRPVLDGRVGDAETKATIERIFALDGDRPLLAWTDTPAQYAALAQRLAEDASYRTDVAAAGKTFTERYFGNPAYAAARFAAVIRNVLARQSGA